MKLVDTHCHIHSADYQLDADEVIAEAIKEGVAKIACVGTDLEDSIQAVEFVQKQPNCYASVGIHPHEAKRYKRQKDLLEKFAALADKPRVVAIGECGLDYFYNHSPKEDQMELLHFQLQLAKDHSLPMIFHIREAFDDFWPIFDQYPGLGGVVHSFTASAAELEQALSRGLYIGLNGIMTFTKDEKQLEMARRVPLQKLLLETDAPFLTPVPFRGTICQPKHVGATAKFLSNLRGETLEEFAMATTHNAIRLFNL